MAQQLSVLVFQGTSGHFVAGCLDYGFAEQAKTLTDAILAFEDGYRARIRIARERGEKPFELSQRAPAEYWRQFEEGKPLDAIGETGAQIRAAAE